MPTARPSIVLDKSYVQGARTLLGLMRDFDLLFPDPLFYEVGSDSRARERSMRKMREVHRTGGLTVGPAVSDLLRIEIAGLRPAGAPSHHPQLRLTLDDFFAAPFDNLPRPQHRAVASAKSDFEGGGRASMVHASTILKCFPDTRCGSDAERTAAFERAAQTIATDRDFVAGFFRDFVCRERPLPPKADSLAHIAGTDTFGPQWTIYRWVQAQLLYALHFAAQSRTDPRNLTDNQTRKAEHDAVDLEYVILGVLEGALASHDKNMGCMFRRLSPTGTLRSLPAPDGS